MIRRAVLARHPGWILGLSGLLAAGLLTLVAALLRPPTPTAAAEVAKVQRPTPVTKPPEAVRSTPPPPARPKPVEVAAPAQEPAPAKAPAKHPNWPKPVSAGAVIGVISPGRPVEPARLKRGIAKLKSLGYQLKLGPHVRSSSGGYAGTAAQRAADLNAMWRDPKVQAIWCARGGKGCLELVGRLDWDQAARRRLPLIGYSDVTILHLAQLKRANLIGISGAMVASDFGYGADSGIDEFTHQDLTAWLRLDPRPTRIAWPPSQAPLVVRQGSAEGRLLGGNLSRIVEMVGGDYLPSLNGAVLLLEDVHETPSSVRAMLGQLASAGVFRKVSAVLLGDFHDAIGLTELHQVVRKHLGDRKVPVISNLAYGHILKRGTYPIGARVQVATSPVAIRVVDDGEREEGHG